MRMETRTRTRTALRGVCGAVAVAVMFWLALAMPELLSDRDSMVPWLCYRILGSPALAVLSLRDRIST